MSVAPGTLGHPQDLMKGMTMEDTWVSRDLPVLEAAVRLLDGGAWEVTVAEIADETGLDLKTVDRALEALTGPYVAEYQRLATGGVPDTWSVTKVTAAARRVVGQWPTAESLAERLAAAFSEAADVEQDLSARAGCARSPASSAKPGRISRPRSWPRSSCARPAWADRSGRCRSHRAVTASCRSASSVLVPTGSDTSPRAHVRVGLKVTPQTTQTPQHLG